MPPCERRADPGQGPGPLDRLCAVILTRRPGQDGASASGGAWMVDGRDQAMVASCLVHQNWVPSIQMQRRIMASLRAKATRAFLAPILLASRTPQAFSGDQRWTLVSSTLAAS